MYKLLIADDEDGVRTLLSDLFSDKFNIYSVDRGDQILDIIREESCDILLLDLHLPKKSGMDVLKEIHETGLDIAVVVLTASNDVNTAISAMKLGAYDYVTKPFDNERLEVILKNISERIKLKNELNELRVEVEASYSLKGFTAQSREMKSVVATLERVIDTDSTILIIGDSGTGKGVLAKAIHYNSNRKDMPFKSVDCSTIPPDLIGSELFGHERGAFTGAVSKKVGKFEAADGGTLFLDEIANLSMDIQAKLLRVLQEKEFERVGGNTLVKVNTRIVAASNKDLRKLVNENKFREDLYYRLNVVPVYIPPLSERKDDIPLFIDMFLDKYNKEYSRDIVFNTKARIFLREYSWPGNVRQLENLLRRIVLLSAEKEVSYSNIVNFIHTEEGSFESQNVENEKILDKTCAFIDEDGNFKTLQAIEKEIIEKSLEYAGYNVSEAAKLLKVSRKTFYNKITKYEIKIDKYLNNR